MRKNYTWKNRMSNTTKTEMVEEMKPGKTDKKDNVEEGRSLQSRRVNYTINEKTAIKKNIKSCREVPLKIKMEKRDLRIFCSTAIFGNIKKIIIETTASYYVLEKTEDRDISGKVVIETIKTKEKYARRALPIFVTNIYRTNNALLINETKVQRFMQEILPVLQSWIDHNEKEIDICDQNVVYPGRQVECNNTSQHKIDHKINE